MAISKKQVVSADQAAGGERKPLPVPEGGWPPDEFTGKPGQFVRDPYTGKRRPADPPAASPAAPDADAGATE